MAVNSEGIYGTRPWKVSGNVVAPAAPEAGFNERNRKDLTANDVRFTTKAGALYAFVMGWPERQALIPIAEAGKVRSVELLGHKGKLKFTQDSAAVKVELPAQKPSEYAVAFKILGA
jgi:alpha-L-fucosidase